MNNDSKELRSLVTAAYFTIMASCLFLTQWKNNKIFPQTLFKYFDRKLYMYGDQNLIILFQTTLHAVTVV